MQRLSGDQKNTLGIVLILSSLAWIAYFSALMGVFYGWVIWPLFFAVLIFFWYVKWISFVKPSSFFIKLLLLAVCVSFFIGFVTEPSVYSGRDQGSISDAALQLAAHHTPFFHTPESDAFFEIYGRGKALNFPGFYYTPSGALTTQFPLPYTAYIASFVPVLSPLGPTTGLIVANVILLFAFIVVIMMLARVFLTQKGTWWFAALLLSAFPVLWFAKFTLSENLASVLLWGGVFALLAFRQAPSQKTFVTAFLSFGLLLFTRIEGLWFFTFFLICLYATPSIRLWIAKDYWPRLVAPLTTLFCIGIASLVVNTPFFLTMAKVLIPATTDTVSSTPEVISSWSFLAQTYTLYNIFPFLILSLILLAIAFKREDRKMIFPFAVVGFVLIYLLDPQITLDHPWMLRRYVFAILPVLVLGSTLLLQHISDHKTFRPVSYIVLVFLIIINLTTTVPLLMHADHTQLTTQLPGFAQTFAPDDLLLLDAGVTGDQWAMLDAPLRTLQGLHATYFFNPDDFAKLNTESFDRVFLITPVDDVARYASIIDDATHATQYSFSTSVVPSQKETFTFPRPAHLETRNMIYQLK